LCRRSGGYAAMVPLERLAIVGTPREASFP
jgi:hypothetical protein